MLPTYVYEGRTYINRVSLSFVNIRAQCLSDSFLYIYFYHHKKKIVKKSENNGYGAVLCVHAYKFKTPVIISSYDMFFFPYAA